MLFVSVMLCVSLQREHRGMEQWLACLFDLQEVGGSNPSSATNI